jgi:hypothetical protein
VGAGEKSESQCLLKTAIFVLFIFIWILTTDKHINTPTVTQQYMFSEVCAIYFTYTDNHKHLWTWHKVFIVTCKNCLGVSINTSQALIVCSTGDVILMLFLIQDVWVRT